MMGGETMDSIQNSWNKAKKTASFIWRHFFTLAILGIGFFAFLEGPLNWKNGLYMVSICIFLDWLKQFSKSPKLRSRMPYSSHNDTSLPLHLRDPLNPSFMGTSSYASDNDFRTKYYD